MASTGERVYGGLRRGVGSFKSSPLKLRAFLQIRRLNFIDYMHALQFALELLLTKIV